MLPAPVPLAVRSALLLLACAAGVVLAGCGSSGTASKDGGTSASLANAVAVVGSRTVPVAEFNARMQLLQLQWAQQGKAFPPTDTPAYNALRDGTTAYLVHSTEFEEKAAEMGITVSDAEVDRAMTAFVKANFGGSANAYAAARNAQGLTDADVRANQRFQLLTNKLFLKVTAKTAVDDRALRAYYVAHEPEFVSKDRRTVRHILVKTKAQADAVYDQLKNGASFVALERKVSKDEGPGRFLMPISKGDTVPNFEAVAFGLKTGQISRPVRTSFGWHVVQALGPIRKGSLQPFAKVEATIRQRLLKQKRNSVMNTWMLGVQTGFCKAPARIRYAPGFAPSVDPCAKAKKSGAAG